MHVVSGETSLIVIDRPIVERIFSTFWAAAGSFTAWICLRFYEPGGEWGDVMLALMIPFLLIFAVTGAWRLLSLPTMICRVDAVRRLVELSLRAPLVRRDASWRFEDVADIHVGESVDRLVLVLKNGRRVALSRLGSAERTEIETIAAAARQLVTAP